MATMATILKVEEVFCYICRGILIEPVRLPCSHVFCMCCFNDCMAETSYSCPMCRMRVSNWVRSARKAGTLQDKTLWERIEEQYSKEVQAKKDGKDDGLDSRLTAENHKNPLISIRGEVAKEYSNFVTSYEEEMRRLREKEERESLELIEKLRQEENEREEARKAREREEQMSLDLIRRIREEEENERKQQERKSLEFIKKLQEEEKILTRSKRKSGLGVALRPRRSKRNSEVSSSSTGRSKLGPMDMYTTRGVSLGAPDPAPHSNRGVSQLHLKPAPHPTHEASHSESASSLLPTCGVTQSESNRSLIRGGNQCAGNTSSQPDHNSDSPDSRDSIGFELNSHFKPIRCVPKTPPKTHADQYQPYKRNPRPVRDFLPTLLIPNTDHLHTMRYSELQAPSSFVQSAWSAFFPTKTDSVLKEIIDNSDSSSFSDDVSGKCAPLGLGAENQGTMVTEGTSH